MFLKHTKQQQGAFRPPAAWLLIFSFLRFLRAEKKKLLTAFDQATMR